MYFSDSKLFVPVEKEEELSCLRVVVLERKKERNNCNSTGGE